MPALIAATRNAFAQSINLLFSQRFGAFWLSSLLANIGTWAHLVAQPWLLLSLGASSFLIGLDAFALGAPLLLLTLVGGILADRTDRRRLIAVCQSIQMLCPVILVLLLLNGSVQPWMIIVLSLVMGITEALSMPAYQSIVPSIVRKDQIAPGLALNATQLNLSRILGPALAGVLMATWGAIACFTVSALSYLPIIAVVLWILPRHRMAEPNVRAFDRHDPFAGLRDILRERKLRGALLTVLTASLLCGPLITFVPVMVKEIYQGDASQFSFAVGAFGLGGLLGAIALLGIDPQRDLRRTSTRFAMALGVMVALAALNPWYWCLPVLLLIAGVSMNISGISANAILQTTASPEQRGQAVSLVMLAMRGGGAIGSLLTGATVSFLGLHNALLLNGMLAVAAHLLIAAYWLRDAPAAQTSNSP